MNDGNNQPAGSGDPAVNPPASTIQTNAVSQPQPQPQPQPQLQSQLQPQPVNAVPPNFAQNQDALKAIHLSGTLAIILGILNILLYPLVGALTYSQSNSGGSSQSAAIIFSAVIGLIIGILFIGLGIKIRKTQADNLAKANKLLVVLTVLIALIIIISLLAGGNGAGVLNLIVAWAALRARVKIRKLQPA